MGTTYIEGFKGMVDEDTLLEIHLTSNHFPPIHPDFHPMAREAIVRVNAGQGMVPIDLPNGITKTAFEIVDGLHLHQFLDTDGEEW